MRLHSYIKERDCPLIQISVHSYSPHYRRWSSKPSALLLDEKRWEWYYLSCSATYLWELWNYLTDRAVQKMEPVVITVPWQLCLREWMQWVLPHKTTMTVEETIFHPEISNLSHIYQQIYTLFFPVIALCLFCSQIIIISHMLFLNRTFSNHKYS